MTLASRRDLFASAGGPVDHGGHVTIRRRAQHSCGRSVDEMPEIIRCRGPGAIVKPEVAIDGG
jgi:hypothetical protein